MSLFSRHLILIASSAFFLLFIALSLATAIQIRGISPQIVQISSAQAAQVADDGDVMAAKALLNGTEFDRGDVFNGSNLISGLPLASTLMTRTSESTDSAETLISSALDKTSLSTVAEKTTISTVLTKTLGSTTLTTTLVSTTLVKTRVSTTTTEEGVPTIMTETQEGIIGFTPEPQSSGSWDAEGVLGPKPTPKPSRVPAPKPAAPPAPQIPILALTYSGSGGPKHCRGKLLKKSYFPPPLERWKNGTCINLPSEARCGVFFSNKGDNCEAALFNEGDCLNTTSTYINTVVFMPEERAVGALWKSMWVRCGVEVPETKMLDPSILGGALKKPGGHG
ncbi:hypothetical protein COCHEDRAFT_1226790 [Bipolaris maydis C5]|uniref:Uncharacterized protein n=2 Tax=Cochliobolus heterostrophus TaxID=5016 RepID=M2U4E7_COCH5|nr:hypothetical protein COCHEDRAFT_1226790 [Bipolaris maydis C5]KAJ5028765.1 hypothetical protein J3E73DRAFT_421982 [Bipolaris maydis]KAJ5063555.1 hypothetical protein J3E74DRAFT_472493 [Bipolaris maydis]KAJ6205578.1 hypothetical protein PSV09DRAFT_1226790 [Bipolaris maydis]KAJ6272937.1 hypothetical protein PSV08DRAFT_400530 [Bipolaris maydis]